MIWACGSKTAQVVIARSFLSLLHLIGSHTYMKLSRTRIAIVLAALVVSSSGCGVVNRIRAKNQLNEAARAYREAHFEEAEQHARNALEIDPKNKEAYKAIASLLGAIKQDQQQRDWITQRANDANADKEKRAEAYVVLA